jgi:hypothetical protein
VFESVYFIDFKTLLGNESTELVSGIILAMRGGLSKKEGEREEGNLSN